MRMEDPQVEDRVKAIMADIFMVEASSIGPSTSMHTLERWDSLAQINLIAALEEEFAVRFEVEEFELMTNFPEVIGILSEKL
jgi:acyl carrier protein